MPLHDHFRPPVSRNVSWEGFFAQWPPNIVKQLKQVLPVGYASAPQIGNIAEEDGGDKD